MHHKRPGGLTALAVFNFIFGGLGLIGIALMAAAFKFADLALEGASEADRAMIEAMQDFGSGMLWMIIAVAIVQSALLIAGGIGYLKLRPWGRSLGNLYGIIGVAYALIQAVLLPTELGGGFQIGTILGLIYPVLTLALLNSIFRDDFARSPA